jgi:hypothetical protein
MRPALAPVKTRVGKLAPGRAGGSEIDTHTLELLFSLAGEDVCCPVALQFASKPSVS